MSCPHWGQPGVSSRDGTRLIGSDFVIWVPAFISGEVCPSNRITVAHPCGRTLAPAGALGRIRERARSYPDTHKNGTLLERGARVGRLACAGWSALRPWPSLREICLGARWHHRAQSAVFDRDGHQIRISAAARDPDIRARADAGRVDFDRLRHRPLGITDGGAIVPAWRQCPRRPRGRGLSLCRHAGPVERGDGDESAPRDRGPRREYCILARGKKAVEAFRIKLSRIVRARYRGLSLCVAVRPCRRGRTVP